MNRDENTAYLRFHRIFPDGAIQSVQLKIDCRTNRVIARMPIPSELPPGHDQNFSEEKFNFNYNNLKLNDSSIRVIKLGGVEDLNPLNYASEVSTILNDPIQVKTPPNTAFVPNNNNNNNANLQKRESKVPNIPTMIRCQNCDTNFPTKYQFQRHQCEFNAEKVVLKPNIDAKDIDKGVRMKFDCPTCGKQFVSKNNLERHLTSHDEDNVNICEFCNKQFVSENRLRIHKENHCKKAGDILKFYRSDVTVWKCVKCYQVFSSDAYACSHSENCTDILNPEEFQTLNLNANENQEEVKVDYVEKVLTELLLQCEYCNKTYADKESLLVHQNTHTTETNYHCVICAETFESYTLAAKHWLTKCVNEANLFYLPKLTYCSTCERTFKSHEVLYSHKIKKKHYKPKRYVDTGEAVVETVEVADKEENKETIIKLIEDVLCSIKLNVGEGKDRNGEDGDVVVKSEMMSENSSLSITENVQEGESTGKKKRGRKRKVASQSSKAKRLANNVDPGYKYQCERCAKVFDRVLDLEAHRDKDHPANYKCEECDQVVHSSKALLIHSRAHQSLKPYVCEICKRCYSQTSHLWQHMRFHQGIKPFACPHEGCEARYTIRPDLKDHIRKVHTRERPFKCSVCSKCFLTGSVYYQHRLIHTNDRRYACDICNKRFFRADALNNHRRIHTDERPYPCDVCGRNFRQKGDRNKHVRTQHPDVQM